MISATNKNRQHKKYLDFANMRLPTLKHFYFFQLVYPLALFFVKASILALYHRIFERAQLRYKIYGVAAFVTIYTIVAIFVNVSYFVITDMFRGTDFMRLSNAGLNHHKLGYVMPGYTSHARQTLTL
jgi:hypothetical protein